MDSSDEDGWIQDDSFFQHRNRNEQLSRGKLGLTDHIQVLLSQWTCPCNLHAKANRYSINTISIDIVIRHQSEYHRLGSSKTPIPLPQNRIHPRPASLHVNWSLRSSTTEQTAPVRRVRWICSARPSTRSDASCAHARPVSLWVRAEKKKGGGLCSL